ncbi:hypothetical protein MAPG_11343, partial [Magnaporthiopsis poae ATCC 64411]
MLERSIEALYKATWSNTAAHRLAALVIATRPNLPPKKSFLLPATNQRPGKRTSRQTSEVVQLKRDSTTATTASVEMDVHDVIARQLEKLHKKQVEEATARFETAMAALGAVKEALTPLQSPPQRRAGEALWHKMRWALAASVLGRSWDGEPPPPPTPRAATPTKPNDGAGKPGPKKLTNGKGKAVTTAKPAGKKPSNGRGKAAATAKPAKKSCCAPRTPAQVGP